MDVVPKEPDLNPLAALRHRASGAREEPRRYGEDFDGVIPRGIVRRGERKIERTL